VKILFDTNVILDALLWREPYASPAAHLMSHVERGRIQGLLGATTVTTIHYLLRRGIGRAAAARHVASLLALFDVAAVDEEVLTRALDRIDGDYEDAVLYEAARGASAEGIVTRDAKGFTGATLPVFAPDALLAVLGSRDA
jgi:predicted nucleic acid-binding protein